MTVNKTRRKHLPQQKNQQLRGYSLRSGRNGVGKQAANFVALRKTAWDWQAASDLNLWAVIGKM
jgi:hypothetical protein